MSEALLKIPELQLYSTIDALIQNVRNDFNSATDVTQTYLYQIFGSIPDYGHYNFFKEAQATLITTEDDDRHLVVRMMFDPERAGIPTIHINMPEETSGANGIGVDQGYRSALFNQAEGTYTEVNTRRFDSTYNIIVTSDSNFQVIVLYNLLKALLTAVFDHLSLLGLENPILGGQDLQIYGEIVPTNIFMRALTLSVQNEISTPKLFSKKQVKDLIFCGEISGSPYKNGE